MRPERQMARSGARARATEMERNLNQNRVARIRLENSSRLNAISKAKNAEVSCFNFHSINLWNFILRRNARAGAADPKSKINSDDNEIG